MTAAQAGEWLKARAREFRGLDRRILAAQHSAAEYTARQPAGTASWKSGRALVESLGTLLRSHQGTLNRWDALVDRLPFLSPGEGLGILPVIPLALAGTVIAVAGSMALIFRRVTAEERAVRLLERGEISPAEAVALTRSIEGGGRALFGLPMWLVGLLGAGGFYYFYKAR